MKYIYYLRFCIIVLLMLIFTAGTSVQPFIGEGAFENYLTQLEDVVKQLEQDLAVLAAEDPSFEPMLGVVQTMVQNSVGHIRALGRWARKNRKHPSTLFANRLTEDSGLLLANELYLGSDRTVVVSLVAKQKLVSDGAGVSGLAGKLFEPLKDTPLIGEKAVHIRTVLWGLRDFIKHGIGQIPDFPRTRIGCAGEHTLSTGLPVTQVQGIGATRGGAQDALTADATSKCDAFCQTRGGCPGTRVCRKLGTAGNPSGVRTSAPVCFTDPTTGNQKCIAFLTSCNCGCLVP